jgi:hypothetical protein
MEDRFGLRRYARARTLGVEEGRDRSGDEGETGMVLPPRVRDGGRKSAQRETLTVQREGGLVQRSNGRVTNGVTRKESGGTSVRIFTLRILPSHPSTIFIHSFRGRMEPLIVQTSRGGRTRTSSQNVPLLRDRMKPVSHVSESISRHTTDPDSRSQPRPSRTCPNTNPPFRGWRKSQPLPSQVRRATRDRKNGTKKDHILCS